MTKKLIQESDPQWGVDAAFPVALTFTIGLWEYTVRIRHPDYDLPRSTSRLIPPQVCGVLKELERGKVVERPERTCQSCCGIIRSGYTLVLSEDKSCWRPAFFQEGSCQACHEVSREEAKAIDEGRELIDLLWIRGSDAETFKRTCFTWADEKPVNGSWLLDTLTKMLREKKISYQEHAQPTPEQGAAYDCFSGRDSLWDRLPLLSLETLQERRRVALERAAYYDKWPDWLPLEESDRRAERYEGLAKTYEREIKRRAAAS